MGMKTIAHDLTAIAPRDELVKFVMDQIEAGINEYLDGYEDSGVLW